MSSLWYSYCIHMKKTLIFILIAALVIPTGTSVAQVTGSDLAASATSSTSVALPEKPLTLPEKKAKAETDLRAVEAKFRLFVSRTQITIDRLAAKGVDTKAAQTELDASLASLDTSKTNLDLFAKISLTDDMTDEQVEKAGVKAALTKIQDALKEARAHLITSLTELKTGVTLTTSQ